jgi:hypothetical protein
MLDGIAEACLLDVAASSAVRAKAPFSDAGGDRRFGVAVLDWDRITASTVSSVDDAVKWAAEACGSREPIAAGITQQSASRATVAIRVMVGAGPCALT